MELYRELTRSAGDSAVALGNFDGLHLGHQKVISLAVEGKARGLVPTVFTFSENLRALFGAEGGTILTQEQKTALFGTLGVEQLYILPFSAVKDLTQEEFVEVVLRDVCRAKLVCCGFNFTFGRGGKGDGAALRRLCARRGIETRIADAVRYGGAPVSSTRIRELIAAGKVDEAARLLGRPYGYRLPVAHGKRLGRELGTPTLNQPIPAGFVLPRFGVYASRVFLDGKVYAGVTNVGVNPTVGTESARAETWMPGYRGPDFYGKAVRVDLVKFFRPEQRFPGIAELKAAILRDGERAKAFFRQTGEILL